MIGQLPIRKGTEVNGPIPEEIEGPVPLAWILPLRSHERDPWLWVRLGLLEGEHRDGLLETLGRLAGADSTQSLTHSGVGDPWGEVSLEEVLEAPVVHDSLKDHYEPEVEQVLREQGRWLVLNSIKSRLGALEDPIGVIEAGLANDGLHGLVAAQVALPRAHSARHDLSRRSQRLGAVATVFEGHRGWARWQRWRRVRCGRDQGGGLPGAAQEELGGQDEDGWSQGG